MAVNPLHKGARERFYQFTGFLWGFSFITFFRYLLDAFYPFYRNYLPISQFALILFAVAFTAAARFTPNTTARWRRFSIAAGTTTILTAAALTAFFIFGTENATLLFAIPLTGIALAIWYALARHAFTYQNAKIFWLIGAVSALYLSRFISSPYAVYSLTLVAIIFSHLKVVREWQTGHERLVNLRLPLDLLRYLFLAQAFHAVLGQNRGNLVIVITICSLGLVAPQLMRRFGAMRPHIGHGLIILPVMFALLAAIFNFLHYSYWGATAYTLLAVWEGIYFAKAHEVYLRREKILAGVSIAAALIGYQIATEWLQIISGGLVILVLTGILYFIGRSSRKTITALLAVAVVSWIFALQWKYSYSVTREFWRPPVLRIHRPVLPDAGLLMSILTMQKQSGRAIYSNVLPDELLNDPAWTGQNIFSRSADPALLTLQLAYACGLNRRDRIYIFDEKSLGLYAEPNALILIGRMLSYFKSCEIFVTDGGSMRSVKTLSQVLRTENSAAANATPEEAAKLLSLARAEKKIDRLQESQSLYEQVYRFYKDDPGILREMSALAAARGQIDKQIGILNSLIVLGKDNTLYDKKLLMELYAIRRERKKSAELAYEILAAGSVTDSPLAIFVFLQKLFAEPFDRTEMQSLYQKIATYQPKTDLEEIKYAGLKRSIEDQLKQNPTYDRKFQDENHRQEFISFPE